MKVLFDTSVLIAAMVESHQKHQVALPWLQRSKRGDIETVVAAHTLAECFAVLTTLPVRPRIGTGIAQKMISVNIEQTARIVSFSDKDYKIVIKQMSEKGLAGGIIYDALITRVALKSGVDQLLTMNISHFEKLWTGEPAALCEP